MHIADTMARRGRFFSLEFFPPKEKEKWPGFFRVVDQLRAVDPLFVSVTYGAGGGTQDYTLEIVTRIKKEFGLEPMAHLTCVGADEEQIHEFLSALQRAGIDNVLALRGDPPQGQSCFLPDNEQFRCAADLTTFIRRHYPEMGVGVACYPEVHPEAESLERDLEFLKHKLDMGGDFAITQLFFDNAPYFRFVAEARAMGVTKPIIPGVLPIPSLASVQRIVSLCGASVPADYLKALEQADSRGGTEAVQALGVEYAKAQVLDLFEQGVPGVHLYTLNKADACLEIVKDRTIREALNSGAEEGSSTGPASATAP